MSRDSRLSVPAPVESEISKEGFESERSPALAFSLPGELVTEKPGRFCEIVPMPVDALIVTPASLGTLIFMLTLPAPEESEMGTRGDSGIRRFEFRLTLPDPVFMSSSRMLATLSIALTLPAPVEREILPRCSPPRVFRLMLPAPVVAVMFVKYPLQGLSLSRLRWTEPLAGVLR